DNNDRPGVVRLEVRSKRDGVTIRSRSDVSLGSRPAGPAPGAVQGKPASVDEMVTTTRPYTALPLRATAVSSRGEGDRMAVLAMIETIEPNVKLTSLKAVLFDPAT